MSCIVERGIECVYYYRKSVALRREWFQKIYNKANLSTKNRSLLLTRFLQATVYNGVAYNKSSL